MRKKVSSPHLNEDAFPFFYFFFVLLIKENK